MSGSGHGHGMHPGIQQQRPAFGQQYLQEHASASVQGHVQQGQSASALHSGAGNANPPQQQIQPPPRYPQQHAQHASGPGHGNEARSSTAAAAVHHGDTTGWVYTIFAIAIAASEVAIGLAIFLAMYGQHESITLDDVNVLKN